MGGSLIPASGILLVADRFTEPLMISQVSINEMQSYAVVLQGVEKISNLTII